MISQSIAMELVKVVCLIVVLLTMVSGEHLTREQLKQLSVKNIEHFGKAPPQQGQMMCAKLSEEPNCRVEMLLGKPWRVYYSWNIDMENQCIDMTFRNATPAIVKRMFDDMNEYMETEPNWDTAVMLAKMGSARHDLLLFEDQGAVGMFQGVPNIVKHQSIVPEKHSVQLRRFYLKLIYGGKYLLMADCQMGVTTLSKRKNKLPYLAEIGGIVSNLDIGPGYYTCQNNIN